MNNISVNIRMNGDGCTVDGKVNRQARTRREQEFSMADSYKTFLKALLGVVILIVGVTMILAWWPQVVALFQGFLGLAFAIAGMLVLYSISK